MKVLFITSDQIDNSTAIAGVSERDLCRPIGAAAKARMIALGYESRTYDPQKTYDVRTAMVWQPDVVILIHCDSPGHSKPQGIMGVMCSRYPDKPWATDVVNRVGALGWGVWGVSTDMALCAYRYYFYRQMDGYKARRLVLELCNMGNLAQATYLREHPDVAGALVADAVHESLGGQVQEDDMTKQEYWDHAKSRFSTVDLSFRVGIIEAERTGDMREADRLRAQRAVDVPKEKLRLDPNHEIWA